MLTYALFTSSDTQISEGMKLAISALLGAMTSYIFIQFSKFIETIESKKSSHRSALAKLEYKLNDQLNWVSDLIFNLKNHQKIVKSVIDGKALIAQDGSSYRESADLESDVHNLLNISFVNQMLKLLTSYKKIQNDVKTLHGSYGFMLNLAISDEKYLESYHQGLPLHLKNTIFITKFAELTLNQTKDALSECRVLSRDSRTLLGNIRRKIILHHDPKNKSELVTQEKDKLQKEINSTMQESGLEIKEIENEAEKT